MLRKRIQRVGPITKLIACVRHRVGGIAVVGETARRLNSCSWTWRKIDLKHPIDSAEDGSHGTEKGFLTATCLFSLH